MASVQEKKHITMEAARESIRSRTTSWLIEQKKRDLLLREFPLKNQIQVTQVSPILNLPFGKSFYMVHSQLLHTPFPNSRPKTRLARKHVPYDPPPMCNDTHA